MPAALAVARLDGDRFTWLPLPAGVADPVAAARQAGGSPLDTPSGLGLDPTRPRLLLACHGSPARPAGHVIELTAAGGDDGAATAGAGLLFAAGDPRSAEARYGRAGLPPGSAWPENPDTVTVDARGRAWIGTDRGGRVGPQAEGLYACDLDGPGRGVPLPIYGAPRAGLDRRRGADPGWRGAVQRRPPSRRGAGWQFRPAGDALAGIPGRRAAALDADRPGAERRWRRWEARPAVSAPDRHGAAPIVPAARPGQPRPAMRFSAAS